MGTDGSLILIFSKELAPKRDFGIFTELEPKVPLKFKEPHDTAMCPGDKVLGCVS
jgi:hypothetical protein